MAHMAEDSAIPGTGNHEADRRVGRRQGCSELKGLIKELMQDSVAGSWPQNLGLGRGRMQWGVTGHEWDRREAKGGDFASRGVAVPGWQNTIYAMNEMHLR